MPDKRAFVSGCWCAECRRVRFGKPMVFQGRVVCIDCWNRLMAQERKEIEKEIERKFRYGKEKSV